MVTKKKTKVPAAAKSTPAVTTPKLTYQNRMRKLTPVARLTAKLGSTIDRFGHLVTEVEAWKNGTEVATAAKVAFAAIEQFANAVHELAEGFVVERMRKTAVGALAAGMFVNVKPKHREADDGIIDDDDLVKLEVLDTRKGRVVCRTQSGEKIILPRGHVEPAPAAAAKKTKAA